MNKLVYLEWWKNNVHREDLDEPTQTLLDHVIALRRRIDTLSGFTLPCACDYDYPGDVCMVHKPKIGT